MTDERTLRAWRAIGTLYNALATAMVVSLVVWRGTAIVAIPHEVSAAMLHGWHGHNGVTLGNPGLGFVCTGMTVDGMPGLEGYYLEHDHALTEGARVRFAYGEETMPRFDPALAPKLDMAAGME